MPMTNVHIAANARETAQSQSGALVYGGGALPVPDADFEQAAYDPDYRSEGGKLSRYLTVFGRDEAPQDVHLDAITQRQPRGWALRQEALRIVADCDAKRVGGQELGEMFVLYTLNPAAGESPGVTAVPAYRVSRRIVTKSAIPSI